MDTASAPDGRTGAQAPANDLYLPGRIVFKALDKFRLDAVRILSLLSNEQQIAHAQIKE